MNQAALVLKKKFPEKVRPDFVFLKVGVLKMAYSGDVIAANFTTLVTSD